MENKFTQGEWRVKESGGCVVGGGKTICQTIGIDDGALSITPEVEANAQLIATAPEMLYALKNCIIDFNQKLTKRERLQRSQYVQKVIDRAERKV